MTISFLNQNNIKYQIRKDGLIKCKSDINRSVVALKFKIEFNISELYKTKVIFTHQQGSLNFFFDIMKMAEAGSISEEIKQKFDNETLVYSL